MYLAHSQKVNRWQTSAMDRFSGGDKMQQRRSDGTGRRAGLKRRRQRQQAARLASGRRPVAVVARETPQARRILAEKRQGRPARVYSYATPDGGVCLRAMRGRFWRELLLTRSGTVVAWLVDTARDGEFTRLGTVTDVAGSLRWLATGAA
jgi:hypothetical protein